MAKLNSDADDAVNRKEEADLTSTAGAGSVSAGAFTPIGRFNATVFGVFVGTVILERSFDGGVTFVPCGALGAVVAYTSPVSEQLEHSGEANVRYRFRMTARTSGTAKVRFSQ